MSVIQDFKVGEQVSVRLFLATCELRKTSTKPPRDFLNIGLTDGAVVLDGKVWNYVNTGNLPEIKKCYDVVGIIGEYAGKKQINITSIKLSADQDTLAFTITVGYPLDFLWNRAMEIISQIEDEKLRYIVQTIYIQHKDKLASASSAKAVHHVGAGGNLLHTIEVCELATKICEQYESNLYPADFVYINKSLVQAGAMLHDIGKAFVYEIDGPVVEYTLMGHLHEHIATGIKMLNAIEWRPSYIPYIDLLEHMIESHHGKQEYGSPVTPKFIEAYIVKYADGISATLNTLKMANDNHVNPDSSITDRIWACDNVPHVTQEFIKYTFENGPEE